MKMPLLQFQFAGIMTTDEVGREYLKETNMMFISGIIVALAIEHCGLHKRIALNCILMIGTSPRKYSTMNSCGSTSLPIRNFKCLSLVRCKEIFSRCRRRPVLAK